MTLFACLLLTLANNKPASWALGTVDPVIAHKQRTTKHLLPCLAFTKHPVNNNIISNISLTTRLSVGLSGTLLLHCVVP